MATEQLSTGEARSELSVIKRKLAWRMVFAGLMIVALLGGLALFDRLSMTRNEPVEPAAPQFTEPVPVPKKALTQPLTPAAPEPEASAAPVDSSAPPAEPPPRPEVSAQPTLPRPSPAARPATQAAPTAATARPGTAGSTTTTTTTTTTAKPGDARASAAAAAPPSPAVPAQPASPPAPSRLLYGYALQAGVFADPRRAEELHAKLLLEGIPSTIEARVEVGPFKSRAEAEAARAKLKSLGIDSLLLPPKGGKR